MDVLAEKLEAYQKAQEELFLTAEAAFAPGKQVKWHVQNRGNEYIQAGIVVKIWGWNFDSLTVLVENSKTKKQIRMPVKSLMWHML